MDEVMQSNSLDGSDKLRACANDRKDDRDRQLQFAEFAIRYAASPPFLIDRVRVVHPRLVPNNIPGSPLPTSHNGCGQWRHRSRSWMTATRILEGDVFPRASHSSAVKGNSIFIFGGVNQEGYSSSFQVFNTVENLWSNIEYSSTVTPEPREGSRLALNENALYLFGGTSDSVYFGNILLWNFSLRAWTEPSPGIRGTPPTGRAGHGFTSVGDKLYIHGGFGGDVMDFLGDLHVLDLTMGSWADLSLVVGGTPPSRRSYHGLAAVGEKLYVYGGFFFDYFFSYYFNDLHVFDPSSRNWTDLTSAVGGKPPLGRFGHGFAAIGEKLYVHGGEGLDTMIVYFDDLFVLDLSTQNWTDLTNVSVGSAPPGRRDHGFAAVGDKLYVFGGYGYLSTSNPGHFGDVHVFDLSWLSWTNLISAASSTGPLCRFHHRFAAVRDKLYVHGGSTDILRNDPFVWDISLRSWTDLSSAVTGSPPSARMNHGFASVGEKLFVHGGSGFLNDGSIGYLDDLHFLDVSSLNWTSLSTAVVGSIPSGRESHGFAAVEKKLYVHGGNGFSSQSTIGFLDDLHVLDLSSGVWTNHSSTFGGTAPSRRRDHGLAVVGEKLYVHGGFCQISEDLYGYLSDLHVFDFASGIWTDLTDAISGSHPLGRSEHGFAAVGAKIYVHGGYTNIGLFGRLGDFHYLDLSLLSWNNLSSSVSGSIPSSRSGHGFLFAENKLFVYGGSGNSVANEGCLGDMLFIKTSQEWIWTNEGLSQFYFIFDWDSVVLVPSATFVVKHPIVLGTESMPNNLHFEGRGGSILRTGEGALVCLVANNCTSISLSNVSVLCSRDVIAPTNSLIKAEGSSVDLLNATFEDCRSQQDGAVVHSYRGAVVKIQRCLMRATWSASRGGAVAAFGSSVEIIDSKFINVGSSIGGGCIWVGAYQSCYSGNERLNSSILVLGCEFLNSSSDGSGGAVLATSESTDIGEQVVVNIRDTVFKEGMAAADGGCISASGGLVRITLVNCTFLFCWAAGDGGGLSASLKSTASLFNCVFSSCLAAKDGGGLSASFDSKANILSSQFSNCSAVQGGGLSAANGSLMLVDLSKISDCTSEESGAVALKYEAQMAAFKNVYFNNLARIRGGGAFYIKQARLLYMDCTFYANTAPSGGGGVLFWEDYVDMTDAFQCPLASDACLEQCPLQSKRRCVWFRCGSSKTSETVSNESANNNSATYDIDGDEFDVNSSSKTCANSANKKSSVFQCDKSNTAAYGECVASGAWDLDLLELPSSSAPAWAGLVFSIEAVKKDVYGQTVVSDSFSVLQVITGSNESLHQITSLGSFARLERGVAVFSVTIKPVFEYVVFTTSQAILAGMPTILVKGNDWDTGILLQSRVATLTLHEGSAVCPPGFILALDSISASTEWLGGSGTCQRCQGGTYSVHPLAPNPALSLPAPSCLNCPAGVVCSRGGNEMTFSAGQWAARRGMLVLVSCPPGHQLVNSTMGTSSGTFWHDGQQCRPCLPGQYIIDTDRDQCQDCPPGANCSEGIEPVVAGSTWTISGGVWTLTGCPAAYYLSESQFLVCPASFYCIGGSVGPTPCGADRFTRPAAPSSAACKSSVFISVVVSLQLVREALTNTRQAALMEAVALTAGNLNVQDVILSGIVQADLALDITIKIAQPDAAAASAAAERAAQPSVVSRELQRAGWDSAKLVSVEETACIPGQYLGTLKRCSLCPAKFYCIGGTAGLQACASASFSPPGANISAACQPSFFVSLIVSLPIDPQLFNTSTAQRLRQAVAETVEISEDHVILDESASKRRIASNGAVTESAALSVNNGSRIPVVRLKQSIDSSNGTRERFCANIFCPDQGKFCFSRCIRELNDLFSSHWEQVQELKQQIDVAHQFSRFVEYAQKQDDWHGHSKVLQPYPLFPAMRNFDRSLPVERGVSRRAEVTGISAALQIAVPTADKARSVASSLTADLLSVRLAAKGLPAASILSVFVLGDSTGSADSSLSIAIGVSVGAVVVIALGLVGLGYGLRLLWRQRWHQAFLKALGSCQPGDLASAQHLPLDLAQHYIPDAILGRGAFGCVVRARLKKMELFVAIKLVLPGQQRFRENEIRQLYREKQMLELLTLRQEAHAVRLADSVLLPVGLEQACVRPWMCWFIMELLDGETLDKIVARTVLDDKECIRVARDVLAGLKALHSEGVIHRDVKPDNLMRCLVPKAGKKGGGQVEHMYKIIDLGTVVGVDATVAKKEMMTLSGQRLMGQGTPPYMSPEMFIQPDQASYPADLWSLGISLFELATRQLPFNAENELHFGLVVAGNLDQKSPSILDHLDEHRRARFDRNLAQVIAKALEKKVVDRYATADEMHEAVYCCLINCGEAFYSAFISYRVASEAPLAHLLFDELNHSVTPGGHRVTVYWDAFRLVKGEDWEIGFATGLLRSLVFLPLLSYGSTAPLAALPEAKRAALVAAGWDERPVGRTRLQGREEDPEDNVLKEFLVASYLLTDASQGSYHPLLQAAYPILVGRQHPQGHPNYPKMGSFFPIQGGGGHFSRQPSMPTNRAVAAFLRDRAGLGDDEASKVLGKSIAWAVETLTRLQGCQLWNHPADLNEADLTKEQRELVGKGFIGPPVCLDGVELTAEQRELCSKGFDEHQLRMMKAQVRMKLGDMHDVIDRAVARMTAEKGENAVEAAVATDTRAGGPEVQCELVMTASL